VGCDHLGTGAVGQVLVQAVAIGGFVADPPRREGVEDAVPEHAFEELDLRGEAVSILTGKSF
jgi:hypothetical protein